MAQAQFVARAVVEQVGLVEHEQARLVAGADLLERLLDGVAHDLQLLLRRRGVEHVHQQVGAARLLERRGEGVDQLVGKL